MKGMSARRTERLLNLVICLLASRRYLSKEQIRASVEQYASCQTEDAFERMFERDKDELREMGIPLETGSNSAWFTDEVGYRIDRDRYALPEVAFDPEEMAILGLAARVWQTASLAEAGSGALLKLKASGVEPDESSLVGIEPRIRATEPAFLPLLHAKQVRRPVTFPYRRPGQREPMVRHIEPWGLRQRRGRWYLVGHDRDREAVRVFRLGRISGPVRADGPDGSVVIPSDVDLDSLVDSYTPSAPQGVAKLLVKPEGGQGLRRRALSVVAGEDDWDKMMVTYWDEESFADELAQYGADVVAVDPPEVRDTLLARLRLLAEVPA